MAKDVRYVPMGHPMCPAKGTFRWVMANAPSRQLVSLLMGLQYELHELGHRIDRERSEQRRVVLNQTMLDWLRRQGAMQLELTRRGYHREQDAGDFLRELKKQRPKRVF